jgi:hypothetical protein
VSWHPLARRSIVSVPYVEHGAVAMDLAVHARYNLHIYIDHIQNSVSVIYLESVFQMIQVSVCVQNVSRSISSKFQQFPTSFELITNFFVREISVETSYPVSVNMDYIVEFERRQA